MTIYEIKSTSFEEVPETTFAKANINERSDLQRLLREKIGIISPDTLVIAEEFGEWVESKRRIDLLGIDKNANLVVIELKRTEDGGHMELQSIRYAAMVSTMTFDQAVQAYDSYLKSLGSDLNARSSMLEFLGWDSENKKDFGQSVRIVLASAEFSKELTTTVLWLNGPKLDIRCVRIKPYQLEGKLLADVQQVIPLPEAEEYIVAIRAKQEQQKTNQLQRDYTRYDVTVNGITQSKLPKRTAILTVVKHLCEQNVSPEKIASLVPWRKNTMFRSADGVLTPDEFLSLAQSDDPSRFDTSRYFMDDLIHHEQKTYVFTNQWGDGFIEAINDIIKAFPIFPMTCEVSNPTE